jgi:hypothetical protein
MTMQHDDVVVVPCALRTPMLRIYAIAARTPVNKAECRMLQNYLMGHQG